MGDVWVGNLSATNIREACFQDRVATMKDFLLLVLVGILTSGCAEKMFQPPPPEFKGWSRPGADELQVKKALLECGFSSPVWLSNSRTYDEMAFGYFCMKQAGYQSVDGSHHWCKNHRDKNLAACAPGASIPTPSVSRRLNSKYCKAKTDYKYCKQNACHPDGCDSNDYKNPAPECLP